MKRLLLVVLGISALAIQAQNKDQMLKQLNNSKTVFLSKSNTITQRFLPQEDKVWQDYMTALKNYVQKNSPDLMPYYTKLANASNTITNNLKQIFAGYISPAILPTAQFAKAAGADVNTGFLDPQKIKLNQILVLTQKLVVIRDQLIAFRAELEKKFLIKPASRQVRDVLKDTNNAIIQIISKINLDAAALDAYMHKKGH